MIDTADDGPEVEIILREFSNQLLEYLDMYAVIDYLTFGEGII